MLNSASAWQKKVVLAPRHTRFEEREMSSVCTVTGAGKALLQTTNENRFQTFSFVVLLR